MTQRFEVIQKVIDALVGTAQSVQAVCEQFDMPDMELDTDFCGAIDAQIFCCTDCNWWCPQEEESSEDVGYDQWICADCAMSNHGLDESDD